MKNTKLTITGTILTAIVAIAVLAGLIINIFLTLDLREVEVCVPPEYPASPLPCAAVPTEFVMQHTECTDHLLRSMNITNVRIQRFNRSLTLDHPNLSMPEISAESTGNLTCNESDHPQIAVVCRE